MKFQELDVYPTPTGWQQKVIADYKMLEAEGCAMLKKCSIVAEYNGAVFSIELGVPLFRYVGGQIYNL